MKSLLIFCGLLVSLSRISGSGFEKKWTSRPQQNVTEICASAPSWTLLPQQSDCRKFYACVNHVVEEFYCANNYHFDKVQLRCVPGECRHHEETTTVSCQPHAVTRVAVDCTAFSFCSGNGRQRTEEHCPPGSYYHPGYGLCRPISMTVDHKCACLMPESTTLTNPDDCETYFACQQGRAVLRECPHGHYYEAAVSSCLPDMEGKCLMAPTMSAVEVMALSICQEAVMAGKIFQPVADDCGKFYLCLLGRVFTKQCGEGFYFDREWNYCRLDVKQKCRRSSWMMQKVEMAGEQGGKVKVQEEKMITPHSPAKEHEKQFNAQKTGENGEKRADRKKKKQEKEKKEEKEELVKENKEIGKENKKLEKETNKNALNKKDKHENNKIDMENEENNKKNKKETDEKEKEGKEGKNKKIKKEKKKQKENKTEEEKPLAEKMEINLNSPLNNNNVATSPNNNNNKIEREVLKPKEKKPIMLHQQAEKETQLQQKPMHTPTKSTNDKLFSKFIKFE